MNQVEIYTSTLVVEGMEISTYGLKFGDIVFDDISTNLETVSNLISLINSMISGDEKSRNLIREMIVNTVASFGL